MPCAFHRILRRANLRALPRGSLVSLSQIARMLAAFGCFGFKQLHIAEIGFESHIEEVAHPWEQPAAPLNGEVGRHLRLYGFTQLMPVGHPKGIEAGQSANGIANNRNQPEECLQPELDTSRSNWASSSLAICRARRRSVSSVVRPNFDLAH